MKRFPIKQGAAVVSDAPAPALESGSVLVRLARSYISAGTELGNMRSSSQSLWMVSDWMFALRPTGPRVPPASFVISWHERLRRRINESMMRRQASSTISSTASMVDTSDQ